MMIKLRMLVVISRAGDWELCFVRRFENLVIMRS